MHVSDSPPAADPERPAERGTRFGLALSPALWHVGVLLAVGAVFQWRYATRGFNLMDEGWALSAARSLHRGWTMYDQLFWVFPPGHALAAWVGWAIDPPGHMIARAIYAAFDLGLIVALYFLGRRFMPAGFALLAGLLVATAAPESHRAHFLFGYRYLLWTALALLCFQRRLATGRPEWLLAAGILVGVAAAFRTTPAFAAGCAIGFGVLFATREWRTWLRDWTWFGAGIAAVVLPILVYFALGVGLDAVFDNVFVRAVVMTAKQAKPIPELIPPEAWSVRLSVAAWFAAFQFRLHPVVYLAYAGVLALLWLRSLRAREPFPHVLLFAVVLWGGIFFVRTLGRSDWGHLESAVPPMCVLLAHACSRVPHLAPAAARPALGVVLGSLLLAGWIWLQGSDQVFAARPHLVALRSAPPEAAIESRTAQRLDARIREIRKWTGPEEKILDLSTSPGFYALADRDGPGHLDLVMPGTFLEPEQELRFIRILESDPPRVIVWPSKPFDGSWLRGLETTAPRLHAWVRARYQPRGRDDGRWVLMVPNHDADRTRQFNRRRR